MSVPKPGASAMRDLTANEPNLHRLGSPATNWIHVSTISRRGGAEALAENAATMVGCSKAEARCQLTYGRVVIDQGLAQEIEPRCEHHRTWWFAHGGPKPLSQGGRRTAFLTCDVRDCGRMRWVGSDQGSRYRAQTQPFAAR